MREPARWTLLVLFAAAMAWMEAATVVYLRTLVGRLEPYQPHPLPLAGNLGPVEMLRESATMLMLASAACLAGSTARNRFGYFLIAFGVWDLLYYVFLAVIGPWPRSLWDWDILFLLPLPWWGPVLAPALIAALMIAGGTLVTQLDRPGRPVWPGRLAWTLNGAGACLALGVFMGDAIPVAGRGASALQALLPVRFNWPLFIPALLLMAAPVVDTVLQMRARRPCIPGVECRDPA